METTLLRRSSAGLKAQIISAGIAAVIFALLASWLVEVIFRSQSTQQSIQALLWLVFIAGWGIRSLLSWFSWRANHYEISPDAIIVQTKAGSWGTAKTLYRYESIISIRMVQGYWGKKLGYGDVLITIPKLDKEVVLRDIDNPHQQLADLQKRLAERSNGANALIS